MFSMFFYVFSCARQEHGSRRSFWNHVGPFESISGPRPQIRSRRPFWNHLEQSLVPAKKMAPGGRFRTIWGYFCGQARKCLKETILDQSRKWLQEAVLEPFGI